MTRPAAREKASAIMREHAGASHSYQPLHDAIAAALLSEREAGRAEMREKAAGVAAGKPLRPKYRRVGRGPFAEHRRVTERDAIAQDRERIAERIRSLPLKKDEET